MRALKAAPIRKIGVKVHKCRGHHESHGPENLLIEGDDEWYASPSGEDMSRDWIEFRVSEPNCLSVESVTVRNCPLSCAVHSARVRISREGKEWITCRPQVLEFEKQMDTLQSVALSANNHLNGEKIGLIRIELMRNYGYNPREGGESKYAFCELMFSGKCV